MGWMQMAGQKDFGGLRLLIAEDNTLYGEMMTELLTMYHAKVRLAKNGVEALRLLRESTNAFDAVLMDVLMPGMNGYETTRAIRMLDKAHNGQVPTKASAGAPGRPAWMPSWASPWRWRRWMRRSAGCCGKRRSDRSRIAARAGRGCAMQRQADLFAALFFAAGPGTEPVLAPSDIFRILTSCKTGDTLKGRNGRCGGTVSAMPRRGTAPRIETIHDNEGEKR